MSKKTIAIIGATGTIGSVFSKNLAKSNYRLLLFDHQAKKLNLLAREIRKLKPSKDIEFMSCASEASWEADIIIPDIPAADEKELAQKIGPFTNRKIVLSFPGRHHANNLGALLPGARIVSVSSATDELRTSGTEVFLDGDDQAIETVGKIMAAAGFVPVPVRNFKNNHINKSNIEEMETTRWTLDPTHSEIHFKIRHLMVSWVTGNFKKFDASVETEGDDLTTAKIRFAADINSISTNNDQRDAHLRTGDFFDAQNHPQLVFESDKLEKIDAETFKLYGTLTMRGQSKKIALNVEYGGMTIDPWGNTRTGFSVTGKLNRKDFGVNFSMVSETGGILLGEEVAINANVEFVKQAALQTQAA